MPTLYETLQARGIPCSNWQSDLYFPVTDETREIVKTWRAETGFSVSTFKSNIDGAWMFDAPFCFDPYWQKRG